MPLYIISYDLLNPGKDYEPLYAALRNLGARKVLFSEWAARRTESAEALRDHVRKFTDSNDRILVTSVDDWASLNAMIKLSDL